MTGLQVDWTTNTSEPRTDSLMETAISPSEKVLTSASPRGRPRCRAICSATCGTELAAKILMSLPCNIHLSFRPSFMIHSPGGVYTSSRRAVVIPVDYFPPDLPAVFSLCPGPAGSGLLTGPAHSRARHREYPRVTVVPAAVARPRPPADTGAMRLVLQPRKAPSPDPGAELLSPRRSWRCTTPQPTVRLPLPRRLSPR